MTRDFARTPWEPEPLDESRLPQRGWKRTLVILGLAFVVAPLLLFGSRFLLARSVSGTVTFSSTASDCATSEGASSFPAGSTIYATVVLERGVSAGESFTVDLLRDGTVVDEWQYLVSDGGNCGSDLIDAGTLAVGRYELRYAEGDEVLATGEFEVH